MASTTGGQRSGRSSKQGRGGSGGSKQRSQGGKKQQGQQQRSQEGKQRQQQKSAMEVSVAATLKRLEKQDPGLRQVLREAYGYAVFPQVGKAALVVGGAFGRGLLFEEGKPVGHVTIGQTTIGVQIGGDTFDEVVVFENEQSLERFKRGRLAFAANASAVLIKAGAAATSNFEKGVKTFVYSEGGMLLEAAIGGQKFRFKPMGEEQEQSGGDGSEESGKGGIAGRALGGITSAASATGGAMRSAVSGAAGAARGAGGLAKTAVAGAGRAAKGAATKTAGAAKKHPVAATLIGTGIATGLAIAATRAIRNRRGGSAGKGKGQSGRSSSGKSGGGSSARRSSTSNGATAGSRR